MLSLLFALLLCFQWVAGDDAAQLARHHNTAATSHVLSQLLVVPSPKFALRDNGDGCDNGWHVCPNFPSECAPDGSYCCNDIGNCPDNTNCFGVDQCCPQDAQTCGGQTCCDPGSTCCSGNNSCCDSGNFCCNDSIGGCCPNGTSCTPGKDTCTLGGGGGGGGGGGSSPTVSLTATTFKPTTQTIGTIPPATIGFSVTPTPLTPNSSTSATPSSIPALGGTTTGGASHGVSVTSIRKTASLGMVVGIIALGGSVL